MFKENSRSFHRRLTAGAFVLLSALFLFSQTTLAQTEIRETRGATSAKANRERGLEMLKNIKDTLKENYYDPNFRGIDIEVRFRAAEQKIRELEGIGEILRRLPTCCSNSTIRIPYFTRRRARTGSNTAFRCRSSEISASSRALKKEATPKPKA